MRTWRPPFASFAQRAASSPARPWKEVQELPSCRICFDLQDEEDGGALVAPCACSGSMRYIHVRCLREWQATQHPARSSCDICRTRYKVVRSAPGTEDDLPAGGGGPAWLVWLRQRWWAQWLAERCANAAGLARRDPQKLLERAIQLSFTANAVVQGGLFAGNGAQRAFLISLRSLTPTVFSFLKWSPELILSSAAFPALQFPIALSGVALVLAAVVEVAVCSAAGAYLGFLYGSSMGTLRMLHWSVRLSFLVPLRTGQAALGAGGKLAKGLGALLAPFRESPRGAAIDFLAQVCLINYLFSRR